MSLWSFRFILWYICVMFVQPQNRFTFLWPLRIANLSFLIAMGLHLLSCMEEHRPLIRFGPATIMALALLFFAMLSQQFGVFQISSAWNPYLDGIVKNALLLIMIEAMATSVERVWAVQMTTLFCTLWWIKGGLRLSIQGATYSGDRLMGIAVSMIENPNGFAYMLCVFLPLYLYAYQQARKKWVKWFFMACALSAVWIIIETGSRTGLVTLIVMSMFLIPYYGRNHTKALLVMAAVLVLIFPLTGEKNKQRFRTIPQSALNFISGGGLTKHANQMTQDEQSSEERRLKNRDTWGLIKENLAFGIGIHPDYSKIPDRFIMARGQVHCEILMAGRQMGIFGLVLYIGLVCVIFFGGWWCRRNARDWPAVRDLGWTFQMQAIAIAVGGFFSPIPWHAPMMMLAGSASALVCNLKAEAAIKKEQRLGI